MKHLYTILISVFIFFSSAVHAQSYTLHGTVYDHFNRQPVQLVTVFASNGKVALSDTVGRYNIIVSEKDSVWFSYLGKQTMKYPVDTITNPSNFEIALYIDVAWLPEVRVRTPNYKLDSLQNRAEYAKYFDFKKPGLKVVSASPSSYVPGSVTVGLDLDEIINMFRFRRNRQILSLQERLIQQEHDKYINHRFTKYFVIQLTGLKETEINYFMDVYRPQYEKLLMMNDIEFGVYIQQCYKNYLFVKGNQ